MKNLLIFVHPIKTFYGEPRLLAKIQIDNSLNLGWKKEDIILATNFEFEYNGVKSILVSHNNFVPYYKQGSKHRTIVELSNRGFIREGELYWFHDLDAYQSEVITELELSMEEADMAVTDYGWRDKLNTGSVFFKASAVDIFRRLVQMMELLKCGDEYALMVLMNGLTHEDAEVWQQRYGPEIVDKLPKIEDIYRRVKKINTSYNFVPYFNIDHCYKIAVKPIKVVHFHPFAQYRKPLIPSILNFYMYGDNEINTVLMPKRLIKIFHKHGIK